MNHGNMRYYSTRCIKQNLLNINIFALALFFISPSAAQINVLLGTGLACGGMPLNPYKMLLEAEDSASAIKITEITQYLILQVPNINLALQVEHQFSPKMMYGINFHLTFVPILCQYRFITFWRILWRRDCNHGY